MTRILPLLFFVFILAAQVADAQSLITVKPGSENLFNEAMREFRAERYREAATLFDTLMAMKPPHQFTTASYLMAAKSYNALGDFDRAISSLNAYFRDFPDSRYADDACYTLGVAELLNKQYPAAAFDLLRAAGMTVDTTLLGRAHSLLEYLADGRITYADVVNFPPGSVTDSARDDIACLVAERLYRGGNFIDAQNVIDSLNNRRLVPVIAARVEALRSRIAGAIDVHIGVLLPLGNDGNTTAGGQAADMLDGIRFALAKGRTSVPEGMNVLLDVNDSGHDTDRAKALMETYGAEKNLLAVIGPMFSNVAFACAPLADRNLLSMLSPTANAVGIAASGPYVFQLNPDLAMHGRAMARYAVRNLGLTKLAVVASTDENLKPLVESFFKEAKSLGARIVDVELYDGAAEDLEDHCLKLRKAGFGGEPSIAFGGKLTRDQVAALRNRGVSQSSIDSLKKLKASVAVTDILGPFGSLIADSLHIPVLYPQVNARDINTPMDAIQAVYAPVDNAQDAAIVLSQFAFYNIRTQILGSAEWYNTSILESNTQAARNILFCSDTYIDSGDPVVRDFGDGFYAARQKPPNRYAMFGFDAMNLVLQQLSRGITTRPSLAKALAGVQNYPGVHTTITLTDGRVNSILNILQYKNGAVTRVAQISGR